MFFNKNKFKAKITHLSNKGFGIARHKDGKSYFVKGTWPGDEGKFEITDRPHRKEKYGYAKLLKIKKKSPDRITPPCPHLGTKLKKCHGCPWMIASYEAQLIQKKKSLHYVFEKNGLKEQIVNIKAIWPSPQTLGYRNRCQFKTDGKKIGYVSEGSQTLAPIKNCIILNKTMQQLLKTLKNRLPNKNWQPGEGHGWIFLDLDDEMKLEELTINKRRPFRQGNSSQNKRMKEWLSLNLKQHKTIARVLELYCGDGNFTEIIAKENFQKITAVEVQQEAVNRLQNKNLPHVTAIRADLYAKGCWKRLADKEREARILILDPPRSGVFCFKDLLKHFRQLQTVFYISCDPEHFAKDAFQLLKKGWKMIECQPLDLFPHTPHVEILAVFKQ